MINPDAHAQDDVVDDEDVVSGSAGKPVTHMPRPTPNGTSGTSTGGQAAAGGAPGVGGSIGTAGSVSVGGSGPALPGGSVTECLDYCSGYERTCLEQLRGRDCFSLCSAEVDGFGPRCQQLGVEALRCMTPSFQYSGLSCDDAGARALGQCAAVVSRFQDCQGQTAPAPVPTPVPPGPMNCQVVSSDENPSYCKLTTTCGGGVATYGVDCKGRGDGYFDCQCYWPTGSSHIVVPASSVSACDSAAKLCGQPIF